MGTGHHTTPPGEAAAVPAVPAATVMFVRDVAPAGGGASELEVCLLRRNARSIFVGGASVFPGGAVDAADSAAAALERCDGLTEDDARARLRIDAGARAHWVAAIREAFEECALLPAVRADGLPLRLEDPAVAQRFANHRKAVDSGRRTLADVLEAEGLRLDLSALHYVAHWVTPVGAPRRYDTRFFVGRAPDGQPLAHDGSEVVAAEWTTPAAALARLEAGELTMLPPTSERLNWLAGFANVEAVLEAAVALEDVPRYEPHFVTELDGSRRIVLTPEAELVADEPVRLSPRVVRVLADNPSVMTGAGTNTYLVGTTELAVIDPGPDDPAHLDAIVAAADGAPIRWIVVTHTHHDHWPGAAPLAVRTGAEVLAFEARDGLEIDRAIGEGAAIAGDGFTLRVLHTPGHSSNHVCLLLEEESLLFTGDHVMHGSTVVIFPPDGDVGDYLASLRRVIEHDPPIVALAPAHGLVFRDPAPVVQAIIDHRLTREEKIAAALVAAGGPVTVDDLLGPVYADVEPRRLPIARGSLWAHLRHLVDQGRASTTGYDDLETGTWTAVPSAMP